MKNGKKLTKKLKIFLTKNNLNYNNWLYIKNTPKELHIIDKINNKIKVLEK